MELDILRNRVLRILIWVSLFITFLPLSALQAASDHAVNRTSRAVWKIYGESSGVQGTAFAIGPQEFITNAHVIKDLYEGGDRIFLSQGSRIIELDWAERISLTYDVAFFTTVERVGYYLKWADSFDSSKEDSLYAVGYPQDSLTVIRQVGPIVSEDSYLYAVPTDKVHRKRSMAGNSGAPIVDSNGDVVAVGSMHFKNELYGVRIQYVKALFARDPERRIGVLCSDLNCLQVAEAKVFELSHKGNPIAQYQIGNGRRGYISEDIDLELMISSGESGIFIAQRELCIWYRYGINGVLKNPEKARYWCQKAGIFVRK